MAKNTRNSSGERLWFSIICLPPYQVIIKKVIAPKNSLIGEASSLFFAAFTEAFSHLSIVFVKRLLSSWSALNILIILVDFKVSSIIENRFPISF